MLQIMLVPLDGSPASEQALPHAQRIARGASARLVLVRAAQAFTVPGVDPTEAQLAAIAEAQAYLDEQAARLPAIGLATEMAAIYGEAASVILDEVRVRKADAVVMAAHGRAGPGRWFFGSVAGGGPAKLVGADHPGTARRGTTVAADRPPRILVPFDGSELAESVLGKLDSFAAGLGAEVVLLQVVELPPYGLYAERGEYLGSDPGHGAHECTAVPGEISRRPQPSFHSVRVRRKLVSQP